MESSPILDKSLSQNRVGRGGQAHFAAKTPQNEPVPDGFGIGSKYKDPQASGLTAAVNEGENTANFDLK